MFLSTLLPLPGLTPQPLVPKDTSSCALFFESLLYSFHTSACLPALGYRLLQRGQP